MTTVVACLHVDRKLGDKVSAKSLVLSLSILKRIDFLPVLRSTATFDQVSSCPSIIFT